MTIRSIIAIDVQDEKFRAFQDLYKKYEDALAKAPGKWAEVTKEITNQGRGLTALAAAITSQTEILSSVLTKQKDVTNEVERQGRAWQGVARWSKGVASDIQSATMLLLKWVPISGLIGAGGLFGLDQLAKGVGSTRRASLGAGTTYGEQSAFDTNFGRLVDPGFLSKVAAIKADASQWGTLVAAGVSTQDIKSLPTAQLAITALGHLKEMADTRPESQYGFQIPVKGGLISTEELRRMRDTSPTEFNQLAAGFGQDRSGLNVPPKVSQAWQDLATQLDRAWKSIEATFVIGLAPLAPRIGELSKNLNDFFTSLEKSPEFGKWVNDAAAGFERLSSFFTKPGAFTDFLFGSKDSTSAVDQVVRLAAGLPVGNATVDQPSWWNSPLFKWGAGSGTSGGLGAHNPGNLRLPGSSTGFANYASDQEGVQSIAHQLGIYARRDHLDTIQGIVSKYAPPNENDTAAYIRDVSGKTGYGAGQHLNLQDTETMARLVAAIVSHEQSRGHYDKYKDAKVVVEVLNNTGGNAVVTVNGLKN